MVAGPSVTASSPEDSEIISSFEILKKHVRGLPLEGKLDEAQAAFSKSDSCTGARALLNALNETRPIAEDLHNRNLDTASGYPEQHARRQRMRRQLAN